MAALYLLALMILLLALFATFRGWRWKRDSGRSHCPWCTYDLEPAVTNAHDRTIAPRCPECGRAARSLDHLHPWRRHYVMIVLGAASMIIALTVLGALPFRTHLAMQLPRRELLQFSPWIDPSEFSAASRFDIKLQAAPLADQERDLLIELLATLIRRQDDRSVEWALEVVRSQAIRRGRIRPCGSRESELMEALVVEAGPGIGTGTVECRASQQARQEVLRYALARLPHSEWMWFCASAIARLGLPTEALAFVRDRAIDPQSNAGLSELGVTLQLASEHPSVRGQAFETIARFLEHRDPGVRIAAADGAARLGGIAMPLVDQLRRVAREDPDRDVQMVASGAERAIRDDAQRK